MKSPRSWLKSVLRAHGIAATYLVRAAGVLAGFLSLGVAVALFGATQTELGRNKALSYIEGALTGAFNGTVELGPVVGGNLLTRVHLERVKISGPDGELFVELDDVRLSYSPFGILGERYTFRRLSADRLKLVLRQYPEGDWNFDRIFGGEPDTIPDERRLPIPTPTVFPPPELELEPEGVRVAIVDGQIREGEVALIWPWAHDLTGEAYEAAARAALAGETVWNVEPEGDGFVRVIRATELSGRFPLVRIAEPEKPVRIDLEMSARIKAVTQPLDFRRFDGSMVFEDSIRFEVREAELGASRLTGRGWITSGDHTESGEGTDFRFDLDGDPIGFADLQWLPIPVPREGGGPGDVVIRSHGGETFVELRDSEVRVRDSRMDGGMVVRLGAMPSFDSLSVRFDPLRLELVDEILERESLIDGYLRGPLSGTGPMDAIDLVADLTAESLDGEAEPSRVRMAGKAGIVEPRLMSGLVLDLEAFEPRWTAIVELPNQFEGRIDGRVLVDDLPDDTVRVVANFEHRTDAGEVSRLDGGLAIHKPTPAVELDATLGPLQLIAVDMYIPQATLIGSVRGAVSLSGPTSDLQAQADLLTPRGSLSFDGSFDLASERKTYEAELEASDIQLREWIEGGPSTDLAVSGRVRGEGTDPADAEAMFDLAVLPSIVEGARIDTSLLRFSVGRGIAEVDTFAIRSELASVDGRGTFGLAADTTGTLLLDVSSDLSRLNRWPASDLMPETPGDGSREAAEDLLADFAPSQAAVGAASDTVAGALTGTGALFGNTERPGIRLAVLIEQAGYEGYWADSLRGTARVANLRIRDTLSFDATAYGLAGGLVGSQPLDLMSIQLERHGAAWTSFAGHTERSPAVSITTEGAFRHDASVGEEEEEVERTAINLRRLDVRVREHMYRLEQAAGVVYGDSGLIINELVLSDGAGSQVRLDGEIPSSGGVDFGLELSELPVGAVLELAPGDSRVDGLMRGSLQVRGTAESPLIDVRLVAERPQLDSTSFTLFTADLAYASQRLEGGIELMGEGRAAIRAEGAIRADLSFTSVEERMPDDAVDVNVRIEELPFEIIRLINSDMSEVEGRLDGTVRVLGRPGGFRYEGDLALSDGSAWMIPLQVRYTDMQGQVTFEGQEARIESFRLRSELGGEGTATGTLGVGTFADPTFDLDLRLDALRAIDKREMNFAVTGDGTLGGSYREPTLGGRVRLSEGNVLLGEVFRGPDVVDLTDPQIASLIDTTLVEERRLIEREQRSFLYTLRAELDVEVGPGAWLRSPDMDVELGGEIDVLMHPAEQDMRIVGRLNLVRGNYRFRLQGLPSSRDFRIEEGTIEFIGSPTPNPRLDIVATHQTRTDRGKLDIEARLTGTISDMDVALTSDPPLSESDQICYLTLGGPCGAFATENQGAATALGLGQQATLGLFGSQLQPLVVGDLGLDLFQVRSAGADQLRASNASFFAGAEVEVGSYIGPDVFFTYTQPLDGRRPDVSLEWYFAEGWTLEARYENRFQRLFSAGSNLETQQSLGLFVFREWSY
jgi:autotransporter translocation and assembly factor TamB